MSKSPELRVVMVGDTIGDQTLDIAAHSDVKDALLRGGLWGPTKDDRIENLSMILSISKDVGHAVVVRGGDFLAEAAIVCQAPNSAINTFRDLLGHDPDDGWFGTIERRNQIASLFHTLEPPFCLIIWKVRASDRLAQRESATLTAELLRVVSGMASELFELIRGEKSGHKA